MRALNSAFLSLAAIGLTALGGQDVQAREIGSVAAVNKLMEGTRPAEPKRALELGTEVVTDELIETTTIGSGQLMFLDQTTLTVAPNSNIVLDKYVFDPDRNTGEMALTMTRGVMRFIGGRISKEQTVVIRTPTATIGIRGAIVVIEVDDQGRTKVTLLAGNVVNVVRFGDGNNDGIDDGPAPGEDLAAAAARQGGITLSRVNASASASRTEVIFLGLTSAGELANLFRLFEGTRDGGTPFPPTPAQIDSGIEPIVKLNSGVPGGEKRTPIAPDGERDAGAPKSADPDEPRQNEGTPAQLLPPDDFIDVGSIGGGGGVPGGGGGVPGGGGGVPGGGGGVPGGGGGVPGGGGGGLPPAPPPQPNPATTGGFLNPVSGTFEPFVNIAFGSIIGTTAGGTTLTLFRPEDPIQFESTLFRFLTAPTPFAKTFRDNVGFYSFFDTESDAALVGNDPFTGLGFRDIDLDFDFAQLFGANSTEFGVVVFGTPTPGQQEVAAFDNGSLPGSVNTAEVYQFEALFGGGTAETSDAGLFLIANGGEARFPGTSGLAANGGALLGATVEFETDTLSGEQFSSFGVLAAPIQSGVPVGGLIITSATAQSEFDPFAGTSYGLFPTGLIEDADGNTIFGPDGDYLVLSSVGRFNALDADPVVQFGQTSTIGNGFLFTESGPVSALATRDLNTQIIVEDPRRFLNDTTPRANPPAEAGTEISNVFSAGIAYCSNGLCGGSGGMETGAYPLRSIPSAGIDGVFQFTHGEGSGALSGTDTNQFFATLGMDTIGFTGFGNSNAADIVLQDPGGPDAQGAYLSDELFASVHDGTATVVDATVSGGFMVASGPLAGTSALPETFTVTALDHEFLRWGWWSATYEVPIAGAGTRTDIVHLGSFVAGNVPPSADIPSDIVATYSGFASAATHQIQTGNQIIEGGTFGLTYNFEARAGSFDLNLGTRPTIGANVVGDPTSRAFYAGTQTAAGTTLSVNGAFFAGGGSPIAATGGTFDLTESGSVSAGVFGGSVTSTAPAPIP